MSESKLVKKIAEQAYRSLHGTVAIRVSGKDCQERQARVLEEVARLANENAQDIRKTYGL